MKKQPLKHLEDPPVVSSSDDDEVKTGTDSDSESERPAKNEKKRPKKVTSRDETAAKPASKRLREGTSRHAEAKRPKKVTSSDDDEVKTGIDSDSESERPTKNEKKRPKKVTSRDETVAKPASKRVKEGTSRHAEAKRPKKVTSRDEENKIKEQGKKKQPFKRLWTEEDEITVLQGMIDFKANTGKSPYDDSNGFYELIKKSISFDVKKHQFMDKIWALRDKYTSKDRVFSLAHGKKCYELSKFIWGPDGLALGTAVKSTRVSRKSQRTKTVKQELSCGSPNGKLVEDGIHGGDVEASGSLTKSDWFHNSFLVQSIGCFAGSEDYVKQRRDTLKDEDKKAIEERFNALQAKELKFVLEKTEFLHAVTSMISEAWNNNAK